MNKYAMVAIPILVLALIMIAIAVAYKHAQEVAYVGSTKSDRFHKPSCRYASAILSENRIHYANRETAIADSRIPCGCCHP